jgi:hypothetical protein
MDRFEIALLVIKLNIFGSIIFLEPGIENFFRCSYRIFLDVMLVLAIWEAAARPKI